MRQLRRIGHVVLLLALAGASYIVTDRLRDPPVATVPAASATDPAVADGARPGGEQATRGRDFEDVVPVALVGSLLLVGGLFLLTVIVPTSAERRRFRPPTGEVDARHP